MLFLDYPVQPIGCGAAHSKYCGKREHQCGEDVVLPQNLNQADHTERIFIKFSIGTSITVALASRTREQHV